ncbi:MAG: hypothetical protein BWZ10_00466 [candidate division BRC1 bacterium ADurb.BinA364]|nr:MAG: hypothetical protein BWZ10_00466 [candidate division BRC1 bacterium ADurb.BinA364]
MYNADKIIPGILLFLALVTFPVWHNAASGAPGEKPERAPSDKETACVENPVWMAKHHMTLLNKWREEVVRNGETAAPSAAAREYTSSANGKTFEKSLVNTCMQCHAKPNPDRPIAAGAVQATYCTDCHDYSNLATPYCWECHVEP